MKKVLLLAVLVFGFTSVYAQTVQTSVPFLYQGTYDSYSYSQDYGNTWVRDASLHAVIDSSGLSVGGSTINFNRIVTTIDKGTEYVVLRVPNGNVWVICYMGDEFNAYLIQQIESGKEKFRVICKKN